MKKTTQTLVLVSVLLLLVFATVSARPRSNPNPAPPVPGEVIGQIRWKKEMGLIPASPGSTQASASACSAFFIIAVSLGMGPNAPSEVYAHSQTSTKQPREDGEYYVCSLSMQLPLDKGLIATAGLGSVEAWPKRSRESIYWTDAWIGGANSQPGAGRRRGFTDFALVNRGPDSKSILHRFEMVYVPSNYEPNFSSTSEKGPSPLLNRATQFAGAWQSNFGGGMMMMILQQTGDRVTGQLKVNSADFGVILDGKIVDNTLRFTVVRRDIYAPHLPGVSVGTGELVMDAGGKSFKGTVLNVAVNGTLLGR